MKRRKPDRELTEEERSVVVSIRHCAGELNDILQGARRKAERNAKVFAENGVSIMFRGLDAYADMYEKLGVKSREAVERLFSKFADCEEIQDTQDAIEETEGNWRDFLTNLDREVMREQGGTPPRLDQRKKSVQKYQYFLASEYPLVDLQTNKQVTLSDYTGQFTSVFVTFQPAFWPDTVVRWRFAEVAKVKADLSQFAVGFVVVTWGPADEIRSWAKLLARTTKWPILWDKTSSLCSRLGFCRGLECVWAAENLDFLGCQRAMFNRPVNPPPTDLNWLEWRQIGGEAVLTRPKIWNPANFKSPNANKKEKGRPHSHHHSALGQDDESSNDEEEDSATAEEELTDPEKEAARDREAVNANETKLCMLHRSAYLCDMAPSGSIYQAALTCYAHAHDTTEALVMDGIRQNRRFSTAPESARLQYETTTGLYYDPETALYYDSARGYFYDGATQMYYYWSQSENRYIPANALIQAELIAAQAAQAAATQAAINRAAAEREAARQAAARVVAQLAEIRAGKDDYAAYAYATCVLPQQEPDYHNPGGSCSSVPIPTVYPNTAAAASNIESSLRAWDARKPEPLVPYADDPPGVESNPPPPGL
ncbi:unnamed protein product [Calicophoron daubneyi]|uniref:OCRE domain-containing protein n=1 Tax=Calicophoron daubneyi TaxID=300641 RepID=A0AAV2SYY4_CALDB